MLGVGVRVSVGEKVGVEVGGIRVTTITVTRGVLISTTAAGTNSTVAGLGSSRIFSARASAR
jgi:hypothetical protein